MRPLVVLFTFDTTSTKSFGFIKFFRYDIILCPLHLIKDVRFLQAVLSVIFVISKIVDGKFLQILSHCITSVFEFAIDFFAVKLTFHKPSCKYVTRNLLLLVLANSKNSHCCIELCIEYCQYFKISLGVWVQVSYVSDIWYLKNHPLENL